MRLSLRVSAAVTLAALAGAGIATLTIGEGVLPALGDSRLRWLLAAGLALPLIVWCAQLILTPIRQLRTDLGNALRAARDGDYGLRLVVRGDRELAEMRQLYNELADAIRTDRHELHNKEVLLDTVLQRTPVGVVLLNAAQRVVYSNATARELLAAGGRLDGRLLDDVNTDLDPRLCEVLDGEGDAIFQSGEETFQIIQRKFRLHTVDHRLVLLERMTHELRRQEVNVWKKAIRLISHEINNSIAPVSSLFHSARRVQEMPEQKHRLEEIYGMIDERLQYLRDFLESYARFARLPQPVRESVRWSEILDPVGALYEFRVEGDVTAIVDLDRGQMQQVVINLVKNAHESGSDPDEVIISIQRTATDEVLRVLDRGSGISDEVMRQAVVPFFTTKAEGTGLGLALCNEIVEAHGGGMRLARREGGGTVATCWLPTSARNSDAQP